VTTEIVVQLAAGSGVRLAVSALRHDLWVSVILTSCLATMRRHSRSAQLRAMLAVAALTAGAVTAAPFRAPGEPGDPGVSILVYHRFGPTAKDAMTVRISTFRWQLDYLRQHGHPIIPLRALVSYLLGRTPPPAPQSVVITADDGHESVFTDMLPVVREYRVPVTLFIYPSAISNASYAMTWDQLDALQRTGLFDIQSHTYWHPNFKTERRRLSPLAYRTFARIQLVKSKSVLKDKLGVEADLIAWPFGICDDELAGIARDVGYIAGFTLDRGIVTEREHLMALPRFLVTDSASGRTFTSMMPGGSR
jgi:peptidoglycan/xylan/chitin deacetylase (PgdA/CDA1 family)